MSENVSADQLPFVLLFSEPLIRQDGMDGGTRITKIEAPETTDDE